MAWPCLTAILFITGVPVCCHTTVNYYCDLPLCARSSTTSWSQVIKSYSPQHAFPAKMLPSQAKDFYLPPQQRHGTSVMFSIFCSVLLCFMGLCKGSRLTGWADLDSPACWCERRVVGVTSRPLSTQGGLGGGTGGKGPRGIIGQPENAKMTHLKKASCSTHGADTRFSGEIRTHDGGPERP